MPPKVHDCTDRANCAFGHLITVAFRWHCHPKAVPETRLTCGYVSGRYWDRTSDLLGVNEVLSR